MSYSFSIRPIQIFLTGILFGLALWVLSPTAYAQETTAEATYADIEETLGFVPDFFKAMPENGVAGLWTTMKTLQMNPNTALDAKTKELIGLAVAAQIPCDYCIHGHTEFAKAAGASEQEIREAIGMAALTRMGSTLIQGAEVDMSQFRVDIEQLVSPE